MWLPILWFEMSMKILLWHSSNSLHRMAGALKQSIVKYLSLRCNGQSAARLRRYFQACRMLARTLISTVETLRIGVYLIDTNVISEKRKGRKADMGVQKFWRSVDEDELFLSVQTVGELRRGVEIIKHRGDVAQGKKLELWFTLIMDDFSERILSFDEECAQLWGRLMSPNNQHPIDKQIAAIALIHGLTIVTRNTDDFRGTGVELRNPFQG
jgi:toxin FitB